MATPDETKKIREELEKQANKRVNPLLKGLYMLTGGIAGEFTGTNEQIRQQRQAKRALTEENLAALQERLSEENCSEIVLALSNDIEGEATCHFIVEVIIKDRPIKVSRIGFGLPSGGGIVYADQITLRSAMDGRRSYSG